MGGSPPALTDDALALLRGLRPAIEYRAGEPMLPALLGKVDRATLTAAGAVLRHGLLPASHSAAGFERAFDEVARLFAGYTNAKGDPVEITGTFREEMKGFPLWVIARALDHVRDNSELAKSFEISLRFAPTVAQMRELCRSIVAPYEARLIDLELVLSVTKALPAPLTDEQQAEIAKGLAGIKRKIEHDSEESVFKREQDARAAEAMEYYNREALEREYARAGKEVVYAAPGIPISLGLAKQLESHRKGGSRGKSR